jgi:hypothetical protein
MPASNSQRAYAAAHFALTLDNAGGGKGSEIGMLRSIEGGVERADVTTSIGGEHSRTKQLGKPKFEDLKLQVGMAMSDSFYDWIKSFFTGTTVRKSGAIVAADFYYKERARRKFTAALIKEVTFPKLDGADKNAAYLSVGLAVESITLERGNNTKLAPAASVVTQKLWSACNFEFVIDGMESACRRVTKVESFTVKQNIIEHHVGGHRGSFKSPSTIEFPNIAFSVPSVDAAPLHERFKKKAGKGEANAGSDRLHGHLTAFDHGKRPLFVMNFAGAEIASITPDRMEATTEEINQVRCELFVESMTFEHKR